MGTLYVVATPIGNLGDITGRALQTLRSVSLIAAEDTRHTGNLLNHFGIATPLISYHSFNERARIEQLLTALTEGDVALVSDAGTPAISDPGYELVSAAIAAGFNVSPILGPSSFAAAVSASGLVDGPVTFLGFLPRKSSDRRQILGRVSASGFAFVLFESPNRVADTLKDLVPFVGNRRATLMRELTKIHEEARAGTVESLATELAGESIRGECVIVIGAGSNDVVVEEDIDEVISRLLDAGMKPSEAAREIAALTGKSRSEVYTLIQKRREAKASA